MGLACRVRVRGLNGAARHDLLVGVGVPLGEQVAERLLELGLHLLGVRAGVRTGQRRVNESALALTLTLTLAPPP